MARLIRNSTNAFPTWCAGPFRILGCTQVDIKVPEFHQHQICTRVPLTPRSQNSNSPFKQRRSSLIRFHIKISKAPFIFTINILFSPRFFFPQTALVYASGNGNLDVVNRLLDCKQIDVNVQDKVSGNVDCVTSDRQSSFLFVYFLCVFLIKNFVGDKNAAWRYRTDVCCSPWTPRCGRSTVSLSKNAYL